MSPIGWVEARLDEFGEIFCGQSPSVKDVNEDGRGIAYVTGPDQWDGARVQERKWTTDPRRVVPEGCVFITVKGAGVGTLFPGIPCAIGRDVYAYKPMSGIDRAFVYYALKQTISQVVREARGDIPGLSKDHLLKHAIGLPPHSEQRRIVAKLEELFSELDAGVAALRRAQLRLTRYRQALLQAAVTGDLTREWREKNGDHLDSSEVLKQSLIRERKSRWRKRNPDKQVDRYKPACLPREECKAELPASWAWVSFAQATDDITVGHVGPMSTRYKDSGTAFLRSQNIRPLRFAREGLVFIDRTFHQELSKSRLFGGELLVVRTGVNVGDACALPPLDSEANCADLVIARPMPQLAPAYGATFINSSMGKMALRLVQTGNAQPHFNIGAMERLGFPLPPMREQRAILAELDRRLSAADALDATLQASLRRTERMRQSILERAFRGELVPQDPNDEPAEALLARLKAAAPEAPASRRRGRSANLEPAVPQSPRRRGRPRKAAALTSGGLS